jgi:hypothetical protein
LKENVNASSRNQNFINSFSKVYVKFKWKPAIKYLGVILLKAWPYHPEQGIGYITAPPGTKSHTG